MSELRTTTNLLDLELDVEVWLAEEEVALERLLALEPGDSLVLGRDPDGPVNLVVNGAVVATGELVVVDGKFGIRVTSASRPELEALRDAQATRGVES